MSKVRTNHGPLLLVLTWIALSVVPTTVLSEDGRALVNFVSTAFEKVERLADLPSDVRAALDLRKAPMAEAGGDWNPGCVTDGRPGRRFIYAGKSPDLWFVFFEVGGRAHYQRLLTLRRKADGALEREGHWILNRVPMTISELKSIVSKDGLPN